MWIGSPVSAGQAHFSVATARQRIHCLEPLRSSQQLARVSGLPDASIETRRRNFPRAGYLRNWRGSSSAARLAERLRRGTAVALRSEVVRVGYCGLRGRMDDFFPDGWIAGAGAVPARS